MAKLTAEEIDKLKQEGLWVKEKCDNCGKPILTPVTYSRGKETWCVKCATGEDKTTALVQENEKMAKAKTEKKAAPKTEKVGGFLRKGTAIGDLYEFLADEKKHTVKDATKALSKHGVDAKGRIGQLKRYGLKKKSWGILTDDQAGTVQMKLGAAHAKAEDKPAAKPAAKKSKAAKGKTTKEEKEDGPKSKPSAGASSKALRATASLVRKALKGGPQTRNKLAEQLKKDYGVELQRTLAAVDQEIASGGLTEEDGELQLS